MNGSNFVDIINSFKLSEVAVHFNGLVQDYNNSIANALELLQSGTKQSICHSASDL